MSAFTQRTDRVKAHITQPPTPSTDLSEGGKCSLFYFIMSSTVDILFFDHSYVLKGELDDVNEKK